MVEIVPYRAEWPLEFRQIAKPLRGVLGNLALRIDHIGSTSVPGLAAKDVIDVQITVTEFSEIFCQRMTTLGYEWAVAVTGDHVPPTGSQEAGAWQKRYFRAPEHQRRTNTHVRIAGRSNQIYPLLFRDFLRQHQDFAAAYAELKRRLAEGLRDPSQYPDVKDPGCDLIYLAAREWAARTGWQVGPTDA